MGSRLQATRKLWLVLGLAVAVWVSFPNLGGPPLEAARFESNGRVYHTRRLPVVVHRVFPPYLGRHVYLRGRR